MAKVDLRKYTAEEIREMNRRGDYVPTPNDAPIIDLDEDFWRELETPTGGASDGVTVHLRVRPSTVQYFDTTGEDLSEMVRVLDAYAAAKTTKKAR